MPKELLNEKEVQVLLDTAAWGSLATIGPEGPYITPLHFVLFKDNLYFHSSLNGRKIDYIRRDDRVCFVVSELLKITGASQPCNFSTRYKSVQVFGRAQVIKDINEKVFALNLIARKYYGAGDFKPIAPDQASSVAVIALRIERISGRANTGLPPENTVQ